MNIEKEAVTLEGYKLYPGAKMHLMARILDRKLTEALSPMRASLYLIVRDWVIENRILYSPAYKKHPFVYDQRDLAYNATNEKKIVEKTFDFLHKKLNHDLKNGATAGEIFCSWPFQTFIEHKLKGKEAIYVCRQLENEAYPSHLKEYMESEENIVTKSKQFNLNIFENVCYKEVFESILIKELVKLFDLHMELPEIRMLLEKTSSKIDLTRIATLYFQVLIKGYIQGLILSEGRSRNFIIDCISDPSSVGLMLSSVISNSNVSELVHGSFLDHTSTIGNRLYKSYLLPSQYICLESISPKIANTRSHYEGTRGRWLYLGPNKKVENNHDNITKKARDSKFELKNLEKHSRVLILDKTGVIQNREEMKKVELDLEKVIEILIANELSISVKPHPMLGMGAPMTSAIKKYSTRDIDVVGNRPLCDIAENFSAYILNYESNCWKELIDCQGPIYLLSARSILDLELLRLGVVDIFWR